MAQSPTIELLRIECPNCAAGIDVAAASKSGRVVCETCGSVLDRGTTEIVDALTTLGNDPGSNIQIGWTCKFRKTTYRVSGRLRYTYPEGFWDEWVMVGHDGTIAYLEECEGEFRWLEPWTPKDAPTRHELEESMRSVRIEGQRYHIKERCDATLSWFAGQLPWRAKAGLRVQTLDLNGPFHPASIEWSKRELEFYKVKSLSNIGIRRLFAKYEFDPGEGDSDPLDSTGKNTIGSIVFVIIIFIAMMFIFMNASSGGGGYVGGGYSGGHSSGGGFGGGK